MYLCVNLYFSLSKHLWWLTIGIGSCTQHAQKTPPASVHLWNHQAAKSWIVFILTIFLMKICSMTTHSDSRYYSVSGVNELKWPVCKTPGTEIQHSNNLDVYIALDATFWVYVTFGLHFCLFTMCSTCYTYHRHVVEVRVHSWKYSRYNMCSRLQHLHRLKHMN